MLEQRQLNFPFSSPIPNIARSLSLAIHGRSVGIALQWYSAFAVQRRGRASIARLHLALTEVECGWGIHRPLPHLLAALEEHETADDDEHQGHGNAKHDHAVVVAGEVETHKAVDQA